MYKWVSWAARTVLTAVLLSFLCIWTTGYIVNSYMETLLKQMELPLQTQPFALSGIWGKLWGADPAPKMQASATATASGMASASASPEESKDSISQPSPSADVSTSSSDNPEEQADPGSPTPPEDSAVVPVLGGQSKNSEMTDQQRLSLQTVMSKLNADQLSKLSAYLKDGLTSEELAQVSDMIKPSLSEEEYKQMMELLKTHTAAESPPPDQP